MAEYTWSETGTHLGNLAVLSNAKTRSVSPENFSGGKGVGAMAETGTASHASRDLGKGWKVNPYMKVEPHSEVVLADIEGPGCLQHIWLTHSAIVPSRFIILRMYWDDCEVPSVEVPLGDFFANAYGPDFKHLNSHAICVNPRNGVNCYWQMPFRKRARITAESLGDDAIALYYQVDYCLDDIPDDAGYFHAQFRRSNPLTCKSVHTILDRIEGKGHYVGTYMAWGVNNSGWWGEGEIKFYLDRDDEYPTVCGTGTEDYFCGAYNFDNERRYERFCTPYSGMIPYVPNGLYKSQQRFSLYRWHIVDPIRFDSDLRVTIQALGWRSGGRYLPMQDDISSVAFWYQDKPCLNMPTIPDRDGLEII